VFKQLLTRRVVAHQAELRARKHPEPRAPGGRPWWAGQLRRAGTGRASRIAA